MSSKKNLVPIEAYEMDPDVARKTARMIDMAINIENGTPTAEDFEAIDKEIAELSQLILISLIIPYEYKTRMEVELETIRLVGKKQKRRVLGLG